MSRELLFSVRILTTLAEVESVRDVWTAWRKNPEADIDYFLLMLRLRPEIVRPHVLLVLEQNEPVALVAGRIEAHQLEITSGNRRFWRAKVRRLALFQDGFMGRTDASVTAFVVRLLWQSLRQEGVDLMVWDGVHCQSPLHRALQRQPNPLCRDYLARASQNWVMELPASLHEMFQQRMSKKRRYWARRTIRALDKDFPGAVRHLRFSKPEDVDQLWREATTLARQSYQWKLGVGFQDTQEQRMRLEIAARKGWLYAAVLHLGERPAAFWICTRHEDSLCLDYTGFDPEFARYEAGTVALFQIIDEMCKSGCRHICLGGGSYAYKQKFGSPQFKEATLLAFSPSFRGVRLNLLRLLILGPVELVRWVAEFLGLAPGLKRLWQAEPAPRSELPAAGKQGGAIAPKSSASRTANDRAGMPVMLWRLLFAVLLVAVVYLSWKSSPAIVSVPWMPLALGLWFDRHDFTKNLSGYGAVAVAGFMAWGGRRKPANAGDPGAQESGGDGKLLLLFCSLVVVLELGQLALPSRSCDWADILAGWTGIALAWFCHRLTQGRARLES